ncbi:MAG: hypothetical protein C0519_06715 [Hyphomicrobium sp.]|nr:hypothetical protein [Hyphomicrobium sp.]
MMEVSPKLLRVGGAAKYLDVSKRTIWRYVDRGLKAIKIGRCTRFAIADIDDFIERHREG